MAINTTYRILKGTPEVLTSLNKIKQEDLPLIQQLEIDTVFKPAQNRLDVFFYSLDGRLLSSIIDSKSYSVIKGGSKESNRIEDITLNPEKDSKENGYPNGDVNVLYNFINNLFADFNSQPKFYIESISPDRTEARLLTNEVSDRNILRFVNNTKARLEGNSYFEDFRLNFGKNNLVIATNIDSREYKGSQAVIVKLYEPLPSSVSLKDTLLIEELVGDSVLYEVVTEVSQITEVDRFNLRGPNYDIELIEENNNPTGYLNYNELFSYPVTNSYYEVYSLFNEQGSQISIDHSNFEDFIHFSSAEERIRNFHYKAGLLESYRNQINSRSKYTGSIEQDIRNLINNFDHYDRYLYYETGSWSWPKSTTNRPFQLYSTGSSQVESWYENILLSASEYDSSNKDRLTDSIPSFIREDNNSTSYLLFVDMIGQHFDNIWIYTKAVSDKYNADNRLDYGISKDLVRDAIQNFGITLYNNNEALENLFSAFTGESYNSGSEQISSLIVAVEGSGSLQGSPGNEYLQPMPKDSYQKEVYKRIYHNIPLLLKSKGTERGVRALINTFGIPSDILNIKTFGGASIGSSPFYGPITEFTSSLDKIKIANTDAVVTGSTLSNFTTVVTPGNDYTTDLHTVEIGFSPSDYLNNYIKAHPSMSSFNIDEYIGDPRLIYSGSYGNLKTLSNTVFTSGSNNVKPYNAFDFVRLIKFFDNSIFRTVKEFLPARTNLSTGIIVKPHLLDRSKVKQPQIGWSNQTSVQFKESNTSLDFTGDAYGTNFSIDGEIDTAFITGSSGLDNLLTASYTEVYPLPSGGYSTLTRNNHNEALYTGEYSGSIVRVSNGELNKNNKFKISTPKEFKFAYLPSANFSNLEQFLDNQSSIEFSSGIAKLGNNPYTDVFALGSLSQNVSKFTLNGTESDKNSVTPQSASVETKFNSNIPDGSTLEVDLNVSWKGIYSVPYWTVESVPSVPTGEAGQIVANLISGSTVVDTATVYAQTFDWLYGSQGSGGPFSDEYGLPPSTPKLSFTNTSGGTISSSDWYVEIRFTSNFYRGPGPAEYVNVTINPFVGIYNNNAINLWVSESVKLGSTQNLIKGVTVPKVSSINGNVEPYIKEANEFIFQYLKLEEGDQLFDKNEVYTLIEGGSYKVNTTLGTDSIYSTYVTSAPTRAIYTQSLLDLNSESTAKFDFSISYYDPYFTFLDSPYPIGLFPAVTASLRRYIPEATRGTISVNSSPSTLDSGFVNSFSAGGWLSAGTYPGYAQYTASINETILEGDKISYNFEVDFPVALASYDNNPDQTGIHLTASIVDTSGTHIGGVYTIVSHTSVNDSYIISGSFTASQLYAANELSIFLEALITESALTGDPYTYEQMVVVQPIDFSIESTLTEYSSKQKSSPPTYTDTRNLSFYNDSSVTLQDLEFYYSIDIPSSNSGGSPIFLLDNINIKYLDQQTAFYNPKIKSKKQLTDAYFIQFENDIFIPSSSVDLGVTSSLYTVGFLPGITEKFLYNDYAATSNNVQDVRKSKRLLTVDERSYTPTQGNFVGTFLPVNYEIISSSIANGIEGLDERFFAEVQDSNYSTTGWKNARYEGSTTDNRLKGTPVLGNEPFRFYETFEGKIYPSSSTVQSIRQIFSGSSPDTETDNIYFTTLTTTSNYGSTASELVPSGFTAKEVLISGSSQITFLNSFKDNKFEKIVESRVYKIDTGEIISTNNVGAVITIE